MIDGTVSDENYQTLGLFTQVQHGLPDVPTELGWQEHELFARPGTQFEIHGIRSLNNVFEVTLHEVRIGEDDYRLEGPLDIAIFATQSHLFVPMRLGVVTEDIPLVVCTTPMGNPTPLPVLNFAVFGKESVIDEDRVIDHRKEKIKLRESGPNIFQEAVTLQRTSGFTTRVVQYIEVDVPRHLGKVSSIPEEVGGFKVVRRGKP